MTLSLKELRKPRDNKWLLSHLKEEDKRPHYRCKGGVDNLQKIIWLKERALNFLEKDEVIGLKIMI